MFCQRRESGDGAEVEAEDAGEDHMGPETFSREEISYDLGLMKFFTGTAEVVLAALSFDQRGVVAVAIETWKLPTVLIVLVQRLGVDILAFQRDPETTGKVTVSCCLWALMPIFSGTQAVVLRDFCSLLHKATSFVMVDVLTE